jgi:imidazolonepropionase-like amidohydrolase
MMRSIFIAFLAAIAAQFAHADTVAITNAHIYTMGAGGEIDDGTIVIRNGRIVAVGAKAAAPRGARVIDAMGSPVTPGVFVTGTNIGAVEIDLVPTTNDGATKSPSISAAFDLQYGVDPNATAIPIARQAGVTHALITPGYDGGEERELLFAGQAAVLTMADGVHPVLRPRAAMMLELGEGGAARAGGARGSSIQALKADLDDVRWFMRNRGGYNRGSSRDLRLSAADLQALVPVVQRKMPLLVKVHRASDIVGILDLARQQGLRIILTGVEEGWMVANDIARARVPVLLAPTSNLPDRFETLGASMENAARLHAAGVTIAFSNGDGHRVREVRYDAGNAVAHGLPYKAALEALTINPARIFGLGGTTGSIERGKSADLVIWNGDPLEPATHAKTVIIAGREQPLDTRAQDLARRYRELGGPLPPAYKQ